MNEVLPERSLRGRKEKKWGVRYSKLAYFSNGEPHTTVAHKGKAVPLQACCGPEGSRKLRFPDFMTTAQGCVKVVSLTHRPPLLLGNPPGTHFC